MSFLMQYFSFNVFKKTPTKPEGLIQSRFFFFFSSLLNLFKLKTDASSPQHSLAYSTASHADRDASR